MNELTMRPATPEDADKLVAIALNEWRAIYDGFRPQMGEDVFALVYPDPAADKERQIRHNVASGCCFVPSIIITPSRRTSAEASFIR